MPITLRIENVDSLADGGALEFCSDERGFDLGRDSHLDWTLPDPDRVISGRHCQVTFDNGSYWLTDVSRNGTYLNNSDSRMRSPHRLASGDRLQIGRYLIRVDLTGGANTSGVVPTPERRPPPNVPSGNDIWGSSTSAAVVANQDWVRREQSPPQEPSVLSQFVELPHAENAGRQPQSPLPLPTFDNSALQGVPPAAQFGGLGAPAASPQSRAIGGADAFVATLATAAGVPPATLAARNPQDLAREIGETLSSVAEHLGTLLRFRAAARRMTKSSERTQVSALGNNPLKFVPSHQEALEIMFGPGRPGYLRGPASVTEAMKNLTSHEIATYAAMQKALSRLMDDLSPESIEDELKGVSFGSKKGRAWEIFVSRWRAKEDRSENGMLDAFLKYFAQAYDEASKS